MDNLIRLKTRREFLRTTVLGGAFTWTIPSFLARTFAALEAKAADTAIQVPTGRDSRILVVLQMAGGNDGVNTVVPFANDHYFRARPRLGLPANTVLKLNDELGLHPSLIGFQALYDKGNLGIVNGVGYPNPNRSHFRSTEIWQTASESNRAERFGWIGRYFDNCCAGADPTIGVNIGRQTPQAFAAKHPTGISLQNPENYRLTGGEPGNAESNGAEESLRQMNRPEMLSEEGNDGTSGGSIGAVAGHTKVTGSLLDYLDRTALDAQVSSEKIRQITKGTKNLASYPGGQLANSLKLVARLIGGGLPARVYYVSQGGYDTHTNQPGTHARLLQELGDSTKSFVDDLRAQGSFDRVLLMTFSEFGRRLSENASNGTDHGAAAPMFLIGDKIKAGFIGKYPGLAPGELLNADLKFEIDFRSVYAAVLAEWLKAPSELILGKKFTPIRFV